MKQVAISFFIAYNIKSLMVVPFMKLKSRTEILVPFAAIQAVPIAVIAWYRLQRYAWYRYSAIVIVPLIYVPRQAGVTFKCFANRLVIIAIVFSVLAISAIIVIIPTTVIFIITRFFLGYIVAQYIFELPCIYYMFVIIRIFISIFNFRFLIKCTFLDELTI